MIVGGSYVYQASDQIQAETLNQAINKKIKVETLLKSLTDQIKITAQNEFLIQFMGNDQRSKKSIEKIFNGLRGSQYIEDIYILDPSERIVFDTSSEVFPFFKLLKKESIGGLETMFIGRNKKFGLVSPIIKDGKPVGMLIWRLKLEELFSMKNNPGFIYGLVVNGVVIVEDEEITQSPFRVRQKLNIKNYGTSEIIVSASKKVYLVPIYSGMIVLILVGLFSLLIIIQFNRRVAKHFADYIVNLKNDVSNSLVGDPKLLDSNETIIDEPFEISILRANFFKVLTKFKQLNEGLEEEVKSRTESLKDALKESKQATIAKSQFLASMSHELRTPMNGVIGMVDLMLEKDLTPDLEDQLKIIKNSAESLLNILNDLLDFSKIEAGKIELFYENFNLKEVLHESFLLLKNKAEEKGINYEINLSQSTDIWVLSDSTRLRQIMFNLIGNAIKFTNQGSVKIEPITNYNKESNSYDITILVKDTGIGIKDEDGHRLFQPFSQADASINKHFGGTGLGLSICYKLVELMGGTIDFTSKIGEGSTFYIKCSLKRGEKIAIRQSVETPMKSKLAELIPLRVLVAEDNLINQKVIGGILGNFGYKPHFAQNGWDAVNATKRVNYDLIFMDIQMPGLNGIDATTEILRDCYNFEGKIIALTANVFEDDKKRCLDAGMVDFLSKPVHKDQVQYIIKSNFTPIIRESELENMENIFNQSENTKVNEDTTVSLDEEIVSLEKSIEIKEPVIDKEQIDAIYFADKDLFEELFFQFEDELNVSLQELVGLIEKNDATKIKEKAHYIKGMARNLGAKKIGDLFQKVELEYNSDSFEFDLNSVNQVIEEYFFSVYQNYEIQKAA
ncbi:ATP-binding protein [Bacteriovoracaceae bacterium]|nr:ATP-binding protein [Bacteriovoracaceae bacterium]